MQIILGHKKAAEEVMDPIVEKAAKMGIKFVTFWAFSTENWRRDKEEIKGLMDIFRYVLGNKLKRFMEKGVKIKILGDLTKFPADIRDKVEKAMEMTKDNKTITVIFALNYGGRAEIVKAINKLSHRLNGEREKLGDLTEEEFSTYLDTAEMPDPDLIIRTGGEQRLSGFMPWQAVYSELYFTKILFPDFSETEFEKAVEDYSKRQRRFGK